MAAFFKKTLSFLGLAEDDSRDDIEEDYSYGSGPDRIESVNDTFSSDYRESSGNKFKSFLHREESTKKPLANSKPSPTHRLMSIDGARDAKSARVSVEEPHEFEEVQLIGDDLKAGVPVIINLQNTNPDLAKRVIDFCSGLTYALEGSIKKVADRVFLLAPKNTIVTSNEKEMLRERGLYNQL
jgi:cell division inhibitor SepF